MIRRKRQLGRLLTRRERLLNRKERLLTRNERLLTRNERLLTRRERLLTRRERLLTRRERLLTRRERLLAGRQVDALHADAALRYGRKAGAALVATSRWQEGVLDSTSLGGGEAVC